jgi:RNA polymerase sigma-70 factor (ECF subfamily)
LSWNDEWRYVAATERRHSSRQRLNRESIEQLLESQYQGLLRHLRRKTQDQQLAADLLNEALVTTLEHLNKGRISNPMQIAGYVFEVALNLLRNHRRKLSERPERRAEVNAETLAAGAADPVEVQWGHCIRQVLRELPTDRDRLLIKRFYLDEEDKEIICRDLGISPLHFDKIIFRSRQRMKSLLEQQGFSKADFFCLLLGFTGLIINGSTVHR